MVPWISDAALDKLNAHTWPGNIRELENVIRRALLLCGDATQIEPQDIVFDTPARVLPRHDAAPAAPYQRSADTGSAKLSSVVRHSEADAIFATLAECGGHRLHAAKRLGISERTLRYRLASLRDAGMMKQPVYAGAAQ
jgi:two-component system response regulator FlrC